MTEQQLNNRNLFIQELKAAKWNNNQGLELLFEQGHSVTPEAQAGYQNADFNLGLSYYVERGYLLWECVGKDNPIVLSLRFYPQENLEIILDTIIEAQDTLSVDNCADFVKKMIQICESLWIETSEGLIEASLPELPQY
jgi:hypothetical protein